MTFRRKLLVVFALTVFLSVAGVALLVQWVTRNAFEKTENQRTAALVIQFQRKLCRRGKEVARRGEAVAASDSVTRMATALNGTSSDFAEYFDLARVMAENHQLDFLEILDGRGTIVSSAQWPAKFGYPEPAFESLSASNDQRPFLKLEELQDSTALGFFAPRASMWATVPFTSWVAGDSTRTSCWRWICRRTPGCCCIRIGMIIFLLSCCWIQRPGRAPRTRRVQQRSLPR